MAFSSVQHPSIRGELEREAAVSAETIRCEAQTLAEAAARSEQLSALLRRARQLRSSGTAAHSTRRWKK